MPERKLLPFETIKYIIIGHSKYLFQKYLVQLQKLTPKIKLILRNKEKSPTKLGNKQKIAGAIPSFVTNLQ